MGSASELKVTWVFRRRAQANVVVATLRWAKQDGIKVNKVHFNTAISAVAARGQWRIALMLMQV